MKSVGEANPSVPLVAILSRNFLERGLLKEPGALVNAAASALELGDKDFVLAAARKIRDIVPVGERDVASRLLCGLADLGDRYNLTPPPAVGNMAKDCIDEPHPSLRLGSVSD